MKHRRRIEDLIDWADQRARECRAENRAGPWRHHVARSSALRAALAEIDYLREQR
jgi:hypothetical protein